MVKLLLSSGLLLLIAVGVVGLKKKNASEEAFQPSAIVKTLGETTPTNLINRITISGQSIVLKEYDLTGDRQVFVYGVIDETNSPQIAQQILALGKDPKPMTIVINSPGGSVIDGAEIISAMEAAKGPVNTLCVQICASMAAMIHQYGTNRLMLDRSLVMFHPATGGVQGEVDKMYSRLGALKDFIGEMEQNVARRSKMNYDDYKNKSGIELWLSAKNAAKANVADSVVYVRGSSASKLFQNLGTMRNNSLSKRIPFVLIGNTVTSTDGKFYWVSAEAYRMMFGDTNVSVPQEVKR